MHLYATHSYIPLHKEVNKHIGGEINETKVQDPWTNDTWL